MLYSLSEELNLNSIRVEDILFVEYFFAETTVGESLLLIDSEIPNLRMLHLVMVK